MTRPKLPDDRARAEEANRIVERAARDSDSVLGSAMRRAGAHFAARGDADREATSDPIELWGRRIGRSLSAVAFVVLAYLLGQQLKLW